MEVASLATRLSDSGAMLPIVRKAAILELLPSTKSIGRVEIQGILDDRVVAPLVSLNVRLQGDEITRLPVVFAVFENLNADCDVILREAVVNKLQATKRPQVTIANTEAATGGCNDYENHDDMNDDPNDTYDIGEDDPDGNVENVDYTPVEIVDQGNLDK